MDALRRNRRRSWRVGGWSWSTIGLRFLVVAGLLVMTGGAGASPATSWSTATAGAQALAAYQALSSAQQGSALYTSSSPTTPTPGGTPIYNYSDWSSTGSSNGAFEDAAKEVLTRAKIAGRYLPPLKLVGAFGLGSTTFDVGWRYAIGGTNFWSEIFGDSASLRYDNGSGPFPQVSLVAWDYKPSGVGSGFTSAGWYARFMITSSTSYCDGWYGTANYIVPTGTSLSQNGSDCGLRRYYSAWKLMHDNSAIASSMGTFQTESSGCPTFYSGGGTSGATGCGVVYRSESDMLARLRATAPVVYTSQTAPGGTTNTGTYTVPSGQGGSSDVTASDAFILPSSPTWATLTPQQKAALTVLLLSASSGFAPVDDYQTMPNCVGLSESACDSALDDVGATGSRSYAVAGFDDVDVTQPAGVIVSQTTGAGTSFARTSALSFTKNPDPLPLLLRYSPQLRYDSTESFHADSAREITDNYIADEYSNYLLDQDDIVIAAADPSDASPTLSLDHLGSYEAYASHHLREHPGTLFDDANRLHGSTGGYADKMYGRVVPTSGDAVWVQYWFFYYYNSKSFFGGVWGNHEGDWEMMQILLDEDDQPVLATYSQHEGSESCNWSDVTTDDNGHPIDYVGAGSHSNYFLAGTSYPVVVGGGLPVGTDQADGEGGDPVYPHVVDISSEPGWTTWPGRWGSSELSPGSLPSHDAWDPGPYLEESSGCRQEASYMSAPSSMQGQQASVGEQTPPIPVVHARIKGHHAIIGYTFKSFPTGQRRPWTLITTIVPGSTRYLPYTVQTRIRQRSGQIVQKLGLGGGPYKLRFASLTKLGARSKVQTVPLR